jgi:hypothetical protein
MAWTRPEVDRRLDHPKRRSELLDPGSSASELDGPTMDRVEPGGGLGVSPPGAPGVAG